MRLHIVHGQEYFLASQFANAEDDKVDRRQRVAPPLSMNDLSSYAKSLRNPAKGVKPVDHTTDGQIGIGQQRLGPRVKDSPWIDEAGINVVKTQE